GDDLDVDRPAEPAELGGEPLRAAEIVLLVAAGHDEQRHAHRRWYRRRGEERTVGTPGSAEDVLPGQQEAGVAGRPAKGAGMMDGEVESAETTAAQPGDAAELGTSGAVPGIERGDDVTDQPVLDTCTVWRAPTGPAARAGSR